MTPKYSNRRLPNQLSEELKDLGDRIKQARKRRRWTMDQMADRMFITRKTLGRLEAGEPGVSISILASALWVLGLERELSDIARPENDLVGKHREYQQLPARVRGKRSANAEELDF